MGLSVLMMNRWLTIALALVIALQSLTAIADANWPHYSQALHHIYDHGHDHEEMILNAGTVDSEPSSTSSSPSLDHSSDHCHQNHAHFHMMPVSAATDITVVSAGQRLSDYHASHSSITPPSLFRPPIA